MPDGPEVLAAGPRPLDRRLLRVLGVGVLLVALLLGGLAVVDRVRGGASSPTVLAGRVLAALDDEDLPALARLVEPAERAALRRVGTALSRRLAALDLPPSVGGGAPPRGARPLDGLDLTLSGATPQVVSTGGDVAVVGLGDLEVAARSEPRRAHGLLRAWLVHEHPGPERETYPEDLSGLGLDGRLVAVERDGRWYLSVLATLLGPGVPAGRTAGVETLAPAPSPTPEAAVEATVRALLDPGSGRDATPLARSLDRSGSDTVQLWAAQLAVSGLSRPADPVTGLTTAAGPEQEGRSVVRIGSVRVGRGFVVAGSCGTVRGERSCLRASGFRYAGGTGSLGLLELLGRDGAFTLTAVRDADGWRTSLPESLADAVVGYAAGLTAAQVRVVLDAERTDAPDGVLEPDRAEDVRFTDGGYALRTLRVTRAGLYRVAPGPAGTDRASLYAPDGQPALQPFFPNDSAYRLAAGDHTLLVRADDAFAATLRTGEPYVQPVEVRSVR